MSTIADVMPPNSPAAERQILSACLMDRDAFYEALTACRAEWFYQSKNRDMFEVMVETKSNDWSTLIERLRSRIQDIEVYITELVEGYNACIISEPIGIMADLWSRRGIIQAAQQAIGAALNDRDVPAQQLVNSTCSRLFAFADSRERSKPVSALELMPQIFDHVQGFQNKTHTGVMTGLIDVDEAVCGFAPGDFVIIAGRPSMGKSTLADTIVRHNGVKLKKKCAVFSVEMSRITWGARMLFAEAGCSYHDAKRGVMARRDYPLLSIAAGPMSEAPIYIDDTPGLTITDIISKSHYIRGVAGGLDLILVDYLQLMSGVSSRDSRQEEISKISRGLKLIAKTFEVPVIALSQLSRDVEKRSPPIPVLSDLRESGAIEQDADVVIMLYREEVYNKGNEDARGVASIIIGKQRNGPVGMKLVKFDGRAMRFLNLEKDHQQEAEGHYADNF